MAYNLAERIEKDFTQHPPGHSRVKVRLAEGAMMAQGFAAFIVGYVPEGREQSLALTKIEEAMFWANAGILRNQEGITNVD